MHQRREFLKLAARVAASSEAWGGLWQRWPSPKLSTLRLPPSRNSEMRRPNIVLIVADDWAHTDLGIAGHPLLKTPNLDRLARDGVHFTHAFTPNPICTPSRAALFTGQDCGTKGCLFFGMPIREQSSHFAQLLSQAGYETFYTGKWHNDGTPSKRGFTSGKYIGGGGPSAGGHSKPMVKDFGKTERRQIERFDSELFTDAAVEFLESQRNDGKPFLLFVSYMTPHDCKINSPRNCSPGERKLRTSRSCECSKS